MTVEREKFSSRVQGQNEPVDKWVTDLRTLARTCAFATIENSLIKDQVVRGVNSRTL